jgi:NAD(P)-dependent dehydrogenase (short-subunit alcohol dehydrogenase family)
VSFGGGAGTAIPKTFEETTLEEMNRVIDINVRGILATTQAALKHMKRGGRIISIGIGRGRACPGSGARSLLGHEGSCKDLYLALSRAREPGITVNNVQPRPIDTDLNPASGDWAVPQKAAIALECYGACSRDRREWSRSLPARSRRILPGRILQLMVEWLRTNSRGEQHPQAAMRMAFVVVVDPGRKLGQYRQGHPDEAGREGNPPCGFSQPR